MSDDPPGAVDLAAGASATEHLHRVLVATRERFPEELGSVELGSADAFRGGYPEVLPRFEAARVATERRSELAAALVEAAETAVVWCEGGEERREGSLPTPE